MDFENVKTLLNLIMIKLKIDNFDIDTLDQKIDDLISKDNKNNNKINELKKEIEILKSSLDKKCNIENE